MFTFGIWQLTQLDLEMGQDFFVGIFVADEPFEIFMELEWQARHFAS